jgi:hypothetical protein
VGTGPVRYRELLYRGIAAAVPRGLFLWGGDLVLFHHDRPHAAEVVPDLAASARGRRLAFRFGLPLIASPALFKVLVYCRLLPVR